MIDGSDDDDIERLWTVAGQSMTDIAYTYKAFFKMARLTALFSMALDLVVVIVTGLLSVSLLRQTFSLEANLALAMVATMVSFLDLFLGLEKQSTSFEQAGDAYNSLFKQFREYVHLTLEDDSVSLEKKRDDLIGLTDRHRDLNELTPTTWDTVFRLIDEEDVVGNIEVTDEEIERLS